MGKKQSKGKIHREDSLLKEIIGSRGIFRFFFTESDHLFVEGKLKMLGKDFLIIDGTSGARHLFRKDNLYSATISTDRPPSKQLKKFEKEEQEVERAHYSFIR